MDTKLYTVVLSSLWITSAHKPSFIVSGEKRSILWKNSTWNWTQATFFTRNVAISIHSLYLLKWFISCSASFYERRLQNNACCQMHLTLQKSSCQYMDLLPDVIFIPLVVMLQFHEASETWKRLHEAAQNGGGFISCHDAGFDVQYSHEKIADIETKG